MTVRLLRTGPGPGGTLGCCLDDHSPQGTAERGRRTLNPVQILTYPVNIAGQMQPQSSAREISGTIEEVLETAQSVGCSVWCPASGEVPKKPLR